MVKALIPYFRNEFWRKFKLNGHCSILPNLFPAFLKPQFMTAPSIVRSEWGIENGLHYRRDVTFHEDKTRMTRKAMARAMTCINNLVIALFYRQGFSNHAHARRVFDAKPLAALALICRL